MRTVETILTLLGLTTALAFLARKVNVPYPIFLVLAGMALAFVPGLPPVSLDPQLVFLLFLPPILYAAGYFTSWRDFRDEPSFHLAARRRPRHRDDERRSRSAVHALVPGSRVAGGFRPRRHRLAAGRVAATAIAKRLGLPRRIVTVLEGESLVNDATGLVLLKFATAAVVTGTFSIAGAAAVDSPGPRRGRDRGGARDGVRLRPGPALSRRPILATTASILVSFLVYIVAERLHVSGVLAVVWPGCCRGGTCRTSGRPRPVSREPPSGRRSCSSSTRSCSS